MREATDAATINSEFRGAFHFSPPFGWMNDPNGFSFFKGYYHLFYQHYPKDSAWGPMHWGHAISRDLVAWKNMPIALAPDRSYDAEGCWSGSAAVDGDRQLLVYTGYTEGKGHDRRPRRQVQCLAIGDGTVYRKSDANPIIPSSLLPEGASPEDFRDPKLWKDGGIWYCLAANSRLEDGRGQLLLFSSEDLEKWRCLGSLFEGSGALSGMFECPDYFELGGKDVLAWSVMGTRPEGAGYQNPQAVVWSAGKFSPAACSFAGDWVREIDKGPDYYASQTLKAPDGRTIMIGWMQSWHRSMPTHDLGHGWAGQMTIPRELSWQGDRIAQRPVRELEAYRGAMEERRASFSGLRSFPGISGQSLDLEIELEAEGGGRVGLRVLEGGDEYTEIAWDVGAGALKLDRSRGGIEIRSDSAACPNCQIYTAELAQSGRRLSLRMILDRSSIELFADGGTTVMTSTVYPKASSDGIEFFSEGTGAKLLCRAWPLLSHPLSS